MNLDYIAILYEETADVMNICCQCQHNFFWNKKKKEENRNKSKNWDRDERTLHQYNEVYNFCTNISTAVTKI